MKRTGIAVLIALAVSLLLSVAASGALPKKKATYVGEIKSTPFAMRVTLVVSATGKGLTFTYLCGTGRAPTTVRGISIDKTGHFKFAPAAQDWKLAGRFPTAATRSSR